MVLLIIKHMGEEDEKGVTVYDLYTRVTAFS
jgi:hypothetical protein